MVYGGAGAVAFSERDQQFSDAKSARYDYERPNGAADLDPPGAPREPFGLESLSKYRQRSLTDDFSAFLKIFEENGWVNYGSFA